MDVETGMRQVDEAVRNNVGAQNYDEGTESEYRQVLKEVESIAGGGAVEDVVRWISGEVRGEESLPSKNAVEERAAQICRDYDEEIPSSSRLANA
ncbi:hypothetical protein [Halopelagius longus]|uniref:Uncharacterized protein n=1 Tax=Halopelagius longus TaxID=1236180 RepID=A0A1H1D500_9EURY|nr:hypothetical protein [Halopelagius longus]RDI71170.1 hypothetical protein DWB78_05180 [Halopelagius longus]SDQ71533.1 hypothetical protein SAMN05216278_2231 [Halopelagius longus]